MDDFLATAKKKVLAEIVSLSQKRGMKGTQGDWWQFLALHDKKSGARMTDPSKRSNKFLTAFLKTLDQESDLKLLVQCHSKRQKVDALLKNPSANDSKEQSLVRLTLQHPPYAMEYAFPSYNEDWVVSKIKEKTWGMISNAMLAVDCEMVLCKDGSEALVRVCVVDRNLEVKMDELVNPRKEVADYRTEITGISAADLDGITCTLTDIQKSLKKLLTEGTILVGHALYNDLQGGPHNCLNDACAAMKLVLAKVEHDVGDTIPSVQEDVPEIHMAKLFLHWIQSTVPSEELQNALPGNFTIEVRKPSIKGKGNMYSAFAIFENQLEAHRAYEKVQGIQEQDSTGKPQKRIAFRLSTGVVTNLYVRKMAQNGSLGTVSSKRALEVEESAGIDKKQKTGQSIEDETITDLSDCGDDLKGIRRLKHKVQKKSSSSTIMTRKKDNRLLVRNMN